MMMAYGGMFEALPLQNVASHGSPWAQGFTKPERIIINHQSLL